MSDVLRKKAPKWRPGKGLTKTFTEDPTPKRDTPEETRARRERVERRMMEARLRDQVRARNRLKEWNDGKSARLQAWAEAQAKRQAEEPVFQPDNPRRGFMVPRPFYRELPPGTGSFGERFKYPEDMVKIVQRCAKFKPFNPEIGKFEAAASILVASALRMGETDHEALKEYIRTAYRQHYGDADESSLLAQEYKRALNDFVLDGWIEEDIERFTKNVPDKNTQPNNQPPA